MSFDNSFKFLFLFGFFALIMSFGYSADCVSGSLQDTCEIKILNNDKYEKTLKYTIPDNMCLENTSQVTTCGGKSTLKISTDWLSWNIGGDETVINNKYVPKYTFNSYGPANNIESNLIYQINRDDISDTWDNRTYTVNWKASTENAKIGTLTLTSKFKLNNIVETFNFCPKLTNNSCYLSGSSGQEIKGCFKSETEIYLLCGTFYYNNSGITSISALATYFPNSQNCYLKGDHKFSSIENGKSIIMLDESRVQALRFDIVKELASNKITFYDQTSITNFCAGSEYNSIIYPDSRNATCNISTLPDRYMCNSPHNQYIELIDSAFGNGTYICNNQYYKKEDNNIFSCTYSNQDTGTTLNVVSKPRNGSGSGSGTGSGNRVITCNSEPNYNCVNGWKEGSYPDLQNVSGNGTFNCNGKYYKKESGSQYYCNPTQVGFWQNFFTKLKESFKKKSSIVETDSEELLAYEGDLDETFNALDEPLNPFLTASIDFSGSYLSKYLIPKNMVNNYTNNIPVNTTYLNNKNLKKENRENFGFIVLHDGGDIPGCKTKFPNDIENCVVRNIINGSWKNSGLSTHYYIGCNGEIFKLVSEDYIAYHAGCKSSYCLLKGMNNISLGIDLRNCHRYTENNIPYTEAQHSSLNLLLQDLKNRGLITTINDEMVIAHFEVLTYKNDPLPGFNWLDITGLTMDHRLLRDSKQETPFQKALKKNLVNPNLA